eukprot:7682663-Pyramimonas_sp.AAC.1
MGGLPVGWNLGPTHLRTARRACGSRRMARSWPCRRGATWAWPLLRRRRRRPRARLRRWRWRACRARAKEDG